jgi:formylglycine-generating enzyme required for sulfatase activity
MSRHAKDGYRDRDDDACPWMIMIPPGRFQMGSPRTEPGRFDNEGPVHAVSIDHAFAAGQSPVTRGEWRRYRAADCHEG